LEPLVLRANNGNAIIYTHILSYKLSLKYADSSFTNEGPSAYRVQSLIKTSMRKFDKKQKQKKPNRSLIRTRYGKVIRNCLHYNLVSRFNLSQT
jgi:hypothetical protein